MYKQVNRWLPGYLASIRRRPKSVDGPIHIMLCVADHYEPLTPGGRATHEQGLARVAAWQKQFPELARQFVDADGCHPKHTFFYPEEEYAPEYLAPLADFCAAGIGEVEIHLHHDNDTPENLRQTLTGFRDLLRNEHGLLGTPHAGGVGYAFIHGNWAICNANPDGSWCGIDNELTVLKETGCYCDMTMPAGAHPAQSALLNSIYYATDIPGRNRSHDRGQPVLALPPSKPHCPLPTRGDMLMIQGPMGLNWKDRKMGFLPRIEYGDLTGKTPPTEQRMALWMAQHVHLTGRPEWIFIKLHTHGCNDENTETLIGKPMHNFHTMLADRYNDGSHYRLHYVSAREMYNLAKAAEAGASGDPNPFRDFAVHPPPVAG